MVATLLCSIAVRAEGATALPQMSTDLENPVFYTISNTRSTSGKYLYYAGDNVGLRDANDITLASLFYFTGTAEACYIHNAATTKKVASVTSWTDAGIEWTIGVTPYGDGTTGLCICPKGNTQSSEYWNEFTYNDAYTTYAANDAGSVFVIEPYAGTYPPEAPEVKPSISSLADADPSKCYTINTAGRGAWTVSADGTMFSSTGYEGFDIDPTDARQQFAILSLNDEDYYLYSVSAKKFIKQGRTLVAGIADAIEFIDASTLEEGRVMVYFKDFGGSYVNVNEREGLVVNSWNTIDAGNAVLISEAGDFDASEALAMLQAGELIELEALKTQVKELVAAHAGNHSSAPAIGQYSTSAYEALAAVADVENLTKEELEEAIAAFEAAKCLPVFTIDGVYRYAAGMSIYENVDGSLLWKETDRTDESMLWVFDMNETVVGVTDKVVVKNLATRNLFWGAAFVQITETSEGIADDGLFLFYTEGVGYPVHADEGRKSVVRWNDQSANSASAWKFTFVGTTYEILDLPVGPETPSGPVTSLSDADPTKCYAVSTTTRGAWAVDAEGTVFSATGAMGLDVDAADAHQQFAILSANDEDYYLYSVSAGKFVKSDGSLVSFVGDAIEFADASSMGEGRVQVRFKDIAKGYINLNNYGQMTIDGWNTVDEGNAVLIAEAGDFDATEALAILANPEGARLTVLLAQAQELLAANANKHAAEPALGQYATDAYENLAATVNSDSVSVAALEYFIAAFEASKCLPVFTIDGVNDYAAGMSVYDGGGQFPNWKATDRTDESMLWVFDMTETTVGVTDKVVVKNYATGNLLMGADFIQVAETSENIADDGLFLIFCEEDTQFSVWASQSGIVVRAQEIFSASSTAAWKFTYAGTTYGIEDAPVVPEIPSDPVTSLSAADPTKCYTISTTTRGAWAVDDAGIHFSTTGVEGYEVDADDARQQFAILSANGEDYYLYSVSAKKFVKRDRTLAVGVGDAIEFVDASSFEEGRVLVRFRDFINANINIGGDYQITIDRWSTVDAGNAVLIAEAGDFDAAEALAALADPEAAELAALVAQVQELVEANAANHAVEPALGQYSTAAYDALVAVANTDSASKASLEAAIAAFEAAKCLPVFTITGFDLDKSIYESTNYNGLYWKELDRTDETMLWVFYMTDTIVGVTDRVVVKNLATGNYFGNGTFIQVTETEEEIADDGYFLIYYEGTGTPLCAYRNGQVMGGDAWSVMSDAAWKFTYVGTTYGANTPHRDALEVLLNRAKGYNPYSGSELGYYVEDFSYLLDAIAEAEALLLGEPSEAECEAMVAELSQAVEQFESSDRTFRLPEPGKVYRIVSALPAFYELQSVEKAITINASDNTLWWGDLCPDSLQQEFVFEPVLGDSGVHLSWNMDINLGNGTTVSETQYFYNLKNVATGLYASYNDSAKFHLDEQPCTVYLTCLGIGQFGLKFRVENEYGGGNIYTVHAGDHNEGVPSDSIGDYGGVFGISSGIVSWYGGLDTPSAWYIRECPARPDTPAPATVTELSAADPTKCYTISTNGRGAWAVDTDGTRFSTTGVEEFDVDAADARQQFAILSANAQDYYLYSVSAKKFVKRDRSLAIGAGDAIEFVDASSQGAGRVMVRFRDIANANINIGGDNQMIIDSWGIIDAGNAVLIAEAGDFDATEALAALADPEGAELNALIAQVEALVEANVSNHAVEPALGQYSTAAYEALSAAVEADSVSKASLEAAIAAFEAAKCLPVFTINGVYGYVDGSSICENGGLLCWKKTDRADRTMLWTFDMTDTIVGVTDRVVVKNLGTGNYFDNAFFVQIAPTRDSIAVDGVYLIYPEGMGLPLYALSSGRVNRGYSWSANSPSGWEFVFAGTTYGINELPVEPDVLEPPVFTETVDATMPLDYHAAADGWIEGTEWYDEAELIVSYTSPMYRFEEKVETFRIAVVKSQGKEQFFCLSELEFYEGNGQKIELTEGNVTSNADHNALNPSAPDGGGIAALFDGKTTTYFHSAWQNIPDEVHYLEVTLPNGGYDTFGFRMISRANDGFVDQSHTFPRRMIITDGDYQRMALSYLLDEAEMLDLYPFPELGYYYDDFSYLREAISEARDLVDNNASEAECEAMVTELLQALKQYKANETPCLRMPEPGKVYHIISAFENFYVNQQVEKAITVNDTLNTLWWEDVNSANLQQGFMFEPVLNGLGNIATQEMNSIRNGVKVVEKHYFFRMKHAATGLYVDYDDAGRFHLVEQPCTLRLSQPGNKHEGQFNILTSRYMGDNSYQTQYLHAGDHNGGVAGTHQGAYGGIGGVSSGIISYYGGAGTPAAWYIREMHELPYTMPVSDAVFRSGFIHFDAADVITLTADRECSFAGLALRDEYGNWLHSLDSEVSGNTITLTLERKIASCAFQFTNYEGVSSVTFDAEASTVEDPSLQLVGVTPDSETSQAWVRALTLSFNKEVYVWSLSDVIRGMNTGEEFHIYSHHIGENSDGGFDLTLYFSDTDDGWTKMITVPDTYTYTISAGSIESVDGEDFPETTITFTVDGTFPVVSYSPAETTSLEQIELTFDKVIEDMNIYYGWNVYNEEGDAVASVEWGSGHGSKTVTLGLNTPITTPGRYYLHIFADAFRAEDDMPNMPTDIIFTVVEDTQNTAKPGDVNGDGNFTMIDVVMTVNAVLEKEQTGFNANAADLNGDGQITMVDVVGVLQLVLTDSSSKAPVHRDSNRTVSMPVLNACELEFMGNGGVVLPVALCNGEDYSAFQLDVQLPAGVELTDVELAGRAKASHTMAWNTLSDGTIRVVAYAMDNASFNNDGGALLNLVLNTSNELSADAEVVLTDGLFASVDGLENRAPAVNVLMRSDATYVDGTVIGTFRVYGTEGAVVVECGTDTAVSIYAATGRLVRQATVEAGKSTIILPSGVYVVNGNKVIVK